jgi:hypothetical protein
MSFDKSTQPDGGAPPPGIGAPAPLTSSESLAEFLAFRKQFLDEIKPRGAVEQTMVYQLAATAWRLRRLPYLESVLVGVLFQRGSAWKELDLLSRHEARLNRAFAQILREIEARRRVSAGKPAQPPRQQEKSASAPAFTSQAQAPPPSLLPVVAPTGAAPPPV